jgi:uncharacterized protein (TIGR03067 family)
MHRLTFAVLLFTPLVGLGADEGPKGSAERDKLQGRWVLEKGYRADGEEISPEIVKETQLIINQDEATNAFKGKAGAPFKFTIDESRSPRSIDWLMGKDLPPRLGIYRLDGDTLEIAWTWMYPEGKRPLKLAPCPKGTQGFDRWSYGVYHRDKTP